MPIPFTLRQLEYFTAVAEYGSVTAAAAARNISQPSVSVAITDLEAIVGQRLFHRQAGQRLSISPAGRRMLVQARTTLAAAGEIVGAGAMLTGSQLSIACFRDIGPMYLPGLLSSFARQNSQIGYRLSEGDLAQVRAQLLDGQCEIAITYAIDLTADDIAFDAIDSLAPYVMLPSDHSLASQDRVNLAALCSERLILEDFPVTLDYFLDIFGRRGLQPRNVQKVSSFEMQRGLVARGWGVGLSCVRPRLDVSYDGYPLVCRPLEGADAEQRIVLAHLGQRTLSAAARLFRQNALDRSIADGAYGA